MIIKNVTLFDPLRHIGGMNLDIEIGDGKIIRTSAGIDIDGKKVIDGTGCYAVPGLIDMHVHLREPGYEYKETIASGTRSAAKGGIVSVLAMPNTNPPLDRPERYAATMDIVRRDAVIDVRLASCMTVDREGAEPVNLSANLDAGFTVFTDDGDGIQTDELMLKIAEEAKRVGALLMEHSEDNALSGKAPVSYGKLSGMFAGQPAEAESLPILRFGAIAGMVGARIHFTHISTKASVEAVRYLKTVYPGLITADCTPHHLLLSEDDNTELDTNKKMAPPLRPESDRQAIEDGLLSGVIDAIATDHAPHSAEEKARPFEQAPFGTIGFETFLPATFTFLVKTRGADVNRWLEWVCVNPARILGLPEPKLIPGNPANLTLFRPDRAVKITEGFFISKSKNSAFMNREFPGEVTMTLYNGKVVYEKT